MKTLLILIMFTPMTQAATITLNIPDSDIKIVENDVTDAQQWIKNAWAGKLANCKKRMINAEIERSLQAKEAIPTTQDAIVAKAMSRKDYKSRKQRDAASKNNSEEKNLK